MPEYKSLTDIQRKDEGEFLREVARRKGKRIDFYTAKVESLKKNPQLVSLTLDSHQTLHFCSIVERFTILDYGYSDFAILSDGAVFGGSDFLFTHGTYIFGGALYLLPEYEALNATVIQTAPRPCPEWAFDFVRNGSGKAGWYASKQSFSKVLGQDIKHRLYSKLNEKFDGKSMLKYLVSNDTAPMDLPLSHFFGVYEKYGSLEHYIDLIGGALNNHIDKITDLHNHPIPDDEIWQITIRDMLARYITEKEFEGGR